MVETKGYNGVWIGLIGSTGTLNPVYGAGFDQTRFKEFKKQAKTMELPYLSHIGQPGIHVIKLYAF